MKLCSVIIPSRGRFDRLKETIRSVRRSARNPTHVEFLVRFDDDDKESCRRSIELADVQCFTGARPATTWHDTVTLIMFLAEHAVGQWLWILNDDMTIQGKYWDVQLSAMPPNCWVQPETHKLNTSIYPKDNHCPTPLIRRSFWEQTKFLLTDYDIWAQCEKAGLELKWLEGITLVHERDDDYALAKHRQH